MDRIVDFSEQCDYYFHHFHQAENWRLNDCSPPVSKDQLKIGQCIQYENFEQIAFAK